MQKKVMALCLKVQLFLANPVYLIGKSHYVFWLLRLILVNSRLFWNETTPVASFHTTNTSAKVKSNEKTIQ